MHWIGRKFEIEQLKDAIHSKRAELGILYGRRRVGKSALLESLITPKQDLYFEGIKGLTKKDQIGHFLKQLSEQTEGLPFHAGNWIEAFDVLTRYISKGRHYVVFDELPWMASEREELIGILKFYWDRHWKKNPNLTLVLCGSIAHFMVNHVLHSEALHNRKTFEMKIEPLPAHEAKEFFKNYRSQREIAEFLMCFGGIPKYLEQINPKNSLSINLNRLCLRKNSFFLEEFETLFKEQFRSTRIYEQIMASAAEASLSKEKLAKRIKHTDGGGFKSYLDNLSRADFLREFSPPGQPSGKTKRYVLWDEWIRFYFTFIRKNLKAIRDNESQNLYSGLIEKKAASYFGLAFERLCLKNMPTILGHLQIPLEEIVDYGPFFKQGVRKQPLGRARPLSEEGLQIDILIVRKRNVLTLVECKFTDTPIGTEVISQMEKKTKLLKGTRKQSIERVLISAGGVTPALEEAEYFHKILNLDCIFLKK